MHVLIIPTGIYPMCRRPLDCIFEQHQAEALQAAGMQVGVLSAGVITTRYLGRRFPYQRHDQVNGIPVFRSHRRVYLPARWESSAVSAERNYRRLKPLFAEYVAAHGLPDIIHGHNMRAGGQVARRLADDFAVPYVITEHTGTYVADPSSAWADREILLEAAAGARTAIAVSNQMADTLRGVLGEVTTVVVVPNVADSKLLATPFKGTEAGFTIVGLGNLISSKNYSLLLEAFVAAEIPSDSQLLIGGEGPKSRELARLANSLGLADRVRLTGYLSRDQVVELMQSADLFAHPSNSESFGVVLIEAMAIGLPVLATASSGPLDIVTPDVGLLTHVGDVGAFADGLSEMYRRRAEFDPERIREACRARFGPDAFAARMLEIYKEATS